MGIWNGYSPTTKAKTLWWSPYAGFDSTKGSHWAWVFLTIIAGILTIPAFLAGFIPGVLLWVFVMELQPEEMADALASHPKRIANKKEYERELTEYVEWSTEQARARAMKKYAHLWETEPAHSIEPASLSVARGDNPADLAADRALEVGTGAVAAVLRAERVAFPAGSPGARIGTGGVAETVAFAVLDRVWGAEVDSPVDVATKAAREVLLAQGLRFPSATASDRAGAARVTEAVAVAALASLPAEAADGRPPPSTTVEA